MAGAFWFNRMAEHWTPPVRLDLVEHVRRARLQVVQAGNFGPQFYGLAGDPQVDRSWVGMPLVGVRQNLEYAAELIARVREAGARYVAQLSMSWHYGDHERGRGLFGAWEQIWVPGVLGTAPEVGPEAMQQIAPGGALRRWAIEGRPYFAYSGCMCNPHWLDMLRAMVGRAIALGVDGFNAHHNFEGFCHCAHCRQYLSAHLRQVFAPAEREALLGSAEPEAADNLLEARAACAPPLRARFALEVQRAAQRRRKQAFDELFVEHGRRLKPDLLLAQWYHKYDFRGQDERSLLPAEEWARDEDYIWYSQGGQKGRSLLARGYLADMGLPARFAHAAGGGRPFVLNKYDFRRWRLSIAEAGAHGGAALAFHWSRDGDAGFALEDYLGPVLRYQGFLAENQALMHPAAPWGQVGLVCPRRGEVAGEVECMEPLKRIGRLLEDRHLLFEILLDEQLEARADSFELLVLPEVKRLSQNEGEVLRRFVEGGGKVAFTEGTGRLDEQGGARERGLLEDLQGGVCRWPAEGLWEAQRVEIEKGVSLPLFPPLEEDAFGRGLLADIEGALGEGWLQTDAPFYVRVRAWWVEAQQALVLHWVNYRQDEQAQIEVPWPVGPLSVCCRLPRGKALERAEWRYPESEGPEALEVRLEGSRVHFGIPCLVVYGLSVLYLREEN